MKALHLNLRLKVITFKEESVCGRNCGFCVFCPNPQKFLLQVNRKTLFRKIDSKLPTVKVFFANTFFP